MTTSAPSASQSRVSGCRNRLRVTSQGVVSSHPADVVVTATQLRAHGPAGVDGARAASRDGVARSGPAHVADHGDAVLQGAGQRIALTEAAAPLR